MSTLPNINQNIYPQAKKHLVLYFHAHQPFRLNEYSIFDIGQGKDYWGGPEIKSNRKILERVAEKCYRPATSLMLELAKTKGIKVAYSLTGTLIEQLMQWAPDTIDIWRDFANTGKMEILGETYYHSLAAFYDHNEFKRQAKLHRDLIKGLFDLDTRIFRNTELTYRNDLAPLIADLDFVATFTEGWDPILAGRSPNYVYKSHASAGKQIKLLLKNYRLSDDIAFRFQLKGWEGYPVTADKFATWAAAVEGDLINLCMDYETVGEHHDASSGIIEFYRHLPDELAKQGIEFVLPSEAVQLHESKGELDFPEIVSWADAERDLSAWTGNEIQQHALESMYKLGKQYAIQSPRDLDTWGRLQTSDHYYYMSTKYWSDGDVHKYFSPYNSPYEAYIYLQNVVRDWTSNLTKLTPSNV